VAAPVDPRAVHRTLDGYAPTPLVEAPSIAAAVGLKRVWVKDETQRLGLPSFKILGVANAVYRALRERLGTSEEWHSLDDWRSAAAAARPLTLVAATEGNHGRALAHLARILGLRARIFVSSSLPPARIAQLDAEGAEIQRVDGTYDAAVRASAAVDSPTELVVSDTSWDGYAVVPQWVIDGYETIFAEVDAQLLEARAPVPGLVLTQAGVGAFAAAAARHEWGRGEAPPRVVAVEPADAACVLAALSAGAPTQLDASLDSIMTGLNCGLASAVALPHLERRLHAVVTVADGHVREAVRLLHAAGIASGTTGAAGVAGLLALHESDEATRTAVGADDGGDALVVCTEGVSDEQLVASILTDA
jgi:diaminopropionate ammonia-lyase